MGIGSPIHLAIPSWELQSDRVNEGVAEAPKLSQVRVACDYALSYCCCFFTSSTPAEIPSPTALAVHSPRVSASQSCSVWLLRQRPTETTKESRSACFRRYNTINVRKERTCLRHYGLGKSFCLSIFGDRVFKVPLVLAACSRRRRLSHLILVGCQRSSGVHAAPPH